MRIVNRRVLRSYHILETLEAGVILTGSEVKQLRAGRVDWAEGHIKIIRGEAFLVNANIPRYQPAAQKDYNPARTRKLLLHKSQIQSLIGKTSSKGIALVPVAIYEKNNNLKVEVGIGKSKREFDKRKIIKERDHKRRIEQELSGKE